MAAHSTGSSNVPAAVVAGVAVQGVAFQTVENSSTARTDSTELSRGTANGARADIQHDDFGLPIRPKSRVLVEHGSDDESGEDTFEDVKEHLDKDSRSGTGDRLATVLPHIATPSVVVNEVAARNDEAGEAKEMGDHVDDETRDDHEQDLTQPHHTDGVDRDIPPSSKDVQSPSNQPTESSGTLAGLGELQPISRNLGKPNEESMGGVSEWSHQALAPREVPVEETEDLEWQEMPAYGKHDLYDDFGRLLVKGAKNFEEEDLDLEFGKGGAGRGYTRVQIDDDAKSQTSMDENTHYLFKDKGGTNVTDEDDNVTRDPLSQMQATKDMLTEGQRIAYVGVTRLSMIEMNKQIEQIEPTKGIKKDVATAVESMKMWGQKMMVRLYAHMDINSSEQVMIEQLAQHGVQPSDLTPALMINSRVKNPLADQPSPPSSKSNRLSTARSSTDEKKNFGAPPPYELHANEDLPEVRNPNSLPHTENIDIDLRWTVLCDLFLVLISDSIYDARSRTLLERVGKAMDITWMDICRFEKRVTDALEMQEEAAKEDWNENDNMESRRKRALKRKYVMMGLATVGGSLVIGLSAGLLAPVIGMGLAAGFSTLGVAGTSGFLAGTAGTAIISTGSAIAGGTIGARASNRRMGAVRTFEYRPLHNNKRVNLIVTVSGWMNGKVDDVRLPFSTVDPIMGDMYSLLWEPDMLQSMGETIRILATEALTQGLQQVLASTILTALMASLQVPVLLTKLAYLIDNPWSVSQTRADAAGLILADSLIDRHLGLRPITLVGFSLGSRLIFSCLQELAKRGAYGLVQNVYIFGSPVVSNKEDWLRARTIVGGRFVNGYASNDWILGYLFRATSGGLARVSGLAPVEGIPGLENIAVTEIVNGHMAYRAAMPRLLREVGWEVDSDEFTEIEDPDPENHEARQRELIKEIEDARQEALRNSEKKKKWWQLKGDKTKKGWETYDKNKLDAGGKGKENGGSNDISGSVLFDIDAIRRELESEHIEVREVQSTLGPMQLTLDKPSPMASPLPNGKITPVRKAYTDILPQSPFTSLKRSKSSASVPARSLTPSASPAAQASKHSTPSSAANNSYDYNEDDDAEPDASITMSFDYSPAQRPELRIAKLMPIKAPVDTPQSLQHNAWACDEDQNAGLEHGEEEIKMTFA